MKDLPWSALAMCIDCEGCISISHNSWKSSENSKGIYNMEIAVRNTDRRLMDWLVSNFGGRYGSQEHKEQHWKISYLWRVTGRTNREKILLGILPYLILKREQALLALEFVRIGKWERNVPRREELHQACKKLNARGRPAPTTNTQECSHETPYEFRAGCSCKLCNEVREKHKIESELIGDYESAPVVTQDGDRISEAEIASPKQ